MTGSIIPVKFRDDIYLELDEKEITLLGTFYRGKKIHQIPYIEVGDITIYASYGIQGCKDGGLILKLTELEAGGGIETEYGNIGKHQVGWHFPIGVNTYRIRFEGIPVTNERNHHIIVDEGDITEALGGQVTGQPSGEEAAYKIQDI